MVTVIEYVGFHPTLALEGFNYIRMRKPIEGVYILYDNKRDRYGAASRRNADKLVHKLEFFNPIRIGINPQSQLSVFSKLYAILRLEVVEKSREVYLDITDMPPEAVATTTLLAMLFKDVHLYVVPSRERGDFIPPPESPKFEEWLEEKDSKRGLEPLEIYRPRVRFKLFEDGDEGLSVRILSTLYDKGGIASSIKDLIKWCGARPTDPATKNRFSRAVDSLARKGLVYKVHKGRERKIMLTDFGKVYAKALKLSIEFPHEVVKPLKLEVSTL
ncbi:MAG: hypothetical protein B6U69_00385 [Thermofilum sp. ex4484_15]|nr:MAG: hypothetical protein B6U69_00385 [Thermofilum sp. ex4484_15]